jgi:hypothetical protein
MRNTADVRDGKPIAVLLHPISGVSAINPLVAFYDIHGGKREVQFFYSVPDTTRGDCSYKLRIYMASHVSQYHRQSGVISSSLLTTDIVTKWISSHVLPYVGASNISSILIQLRQLS